MTANLRALVRGNEFMLIPVALIVGVAGGAVVTLMSYLAQLAHVLIFGIAVDVRLSANATLNPAAALIAPAAGGLLLGAMEWLRRRWKVANAADPIEANALRGGQMSLRDSVVVSGQTLISNGCGASVGLEAGYTQIGAGLASILGRMLNLRRADLRLMVGCGAAAAIAAAFGAPLTGVFYACELIIGVYSVGSAAPILVAAIAATMTARWLGGAPYSLEVSHVGAVTFAQYGALIVLALMVGSAGILVMRLVVVFERIFQHAGIPVWLRPVIGGVCVGGLALITPQVLAAGHGAMVLDLPRDMPAMLIAGSIVLKLCGCLISLASGFRGGLFFASLFVGCLIGKLFTLICQQPIFGMTLDPTVNALTGMASLGVAIVGGPLTMSFLVLELTRNLEVTAGVLAACLVTSIFVRGVFGHSFSTWRLHLRGETIRSANDVGWLRNLTVGRLMRTDMETVRDTATIAECRRNFRLGSGAALFVLNGEQAYCGVALLPELFSSDIDIAAGGTKVAELARYPETVLFTSMNVKTAIKKFEQAEAEILAVLETPANRRLVGFLTESFARRRYGEELDKAANHLIGQT